MKITGEIRSQRMSYKLRLHEKNIDKVIKATDDIAKTLSELILEKWKSGILEMGNVDTEEYINSISIERLSQGKYRIFSDIEHSIYVEYGTGVAVGKPEYTPPFDKILKWVESKLGYSDEGAKAVAWMIIRKIELEGTPPNPSARNSLNDTKAIALNISKTILEKTTKVK
jgi:hypothetical protein